MQTTAAPRFSHAYSLNFNVETSNSSEEVTVQELRSALLKRLETLSSDEELLLAADGPYDTMELDEL